MSRRKDTYDIPSALNAKGQAVDASEYVRHVADIIKARNEGVRIPAAPWLVVGGKKK